MERMANPGEKCANLECGHSKSEHLDLGRGRCLGTKTNSMDAPQNPAL